MSIEAMKQALEALEKLFGIPAMWTGEGGGDVAVWRLGGSYRAQQAITSLRKAIAEAEKQDGVCQHCAGKGCVACDAREQEPVAHLWQHSETGRTRVTFPDSIADCDANWFCVGPLVLGNIHPPQRTEQEPVAWRETHGKVIKALAGIVNVHTPDKLFDLDAIPREPVMGLVQQIKVAIDAYQPQRTEQEPVIDKSAAIRIATALGWEPKRTWVGLTDEEIDDLAEFHGLDFMSYAPFTRAIEAKLKEKNGYAKENT